MWHLKVFNYLFSGFCSQGCKMWRSLKTPVWSILVGQKSKLSYLQSAFYFPPSVLCHVNTLIVWIFRHTPDSWLCSPYYYLKVYVSSTSTFTWHMGKLELNKALFGWMKLPAGNRDVWRPRWPNYLISGFCSQASKMWGSLKTPVWSVLIKSKLVVIVVLTGLSIDIWEEVMIISNALNPHQP